MTTLYKGLPLPYVTFWCVRYVVLEIYYYGMFKPGSSEGPVVKTLALHQDGVGSSLGVNKGGLSLLFALF